MDARTRYYKSFLIFNQEDTGYGSGQAPSGYVRIEVRDGKGKLSASVQNLREDNGNLIYKLYIISSDDRDIYPAHVGAIPVSRGRGDLSWEFDPMNVAGTGKKVDAFNTAVVLAEHLERSDLKIICPLAAYKDKRIPWREKLKEKRRAEMYSKSAGNIPGKKENIKSFAGSSVSSGQWEEIKGKSPVPGDLHGKLPAKEPQMPERLKTLQDELKKENIDINGKGAQEERQQSIEDNQKDNRGIHQERAEEYSPAVDDNLPAVNVNQKVEPPGQKPAENSEQCQAELPVQNRMEEPEQCRVKAPEPIHAENPEQPQAESMEQNNRTKPEPDRERGKDQYQAASTERHSAEDWQEKPDADEGAPLREEGKSERMNFPKDEVTPPPTHEEYGKLVDRYLNEELYGRSSIAFGGCTIAGKAACPFRTPGRNFNQCIGCIGGMTQSFTTGSEPAAKSSFEEFKNALNRYFEVADPFGSKRKDYMWWKVNSPVYLNNILYQYNIRTPLLFNPLVITANFKYRHLIIGIYTDKARSREYIVCGIPGVYGIDSKPFGEMCRWVQLEGNKPKYGAFGYWLVYIDPKTGKFLPLN